jgi:Plavaka transposase
MRRAHGSGLVLIGFLSIPKSLLCLSIMHISTDFVSSADKAHTNDVDFRQFRRKLFHVSLSYILQSLQPGEVTPEVFRCPDRHFRRIIWGIGPYIADYPEQVLLACIVRNWCAR